MRRGQYKQKLSARERCGDIYFSNVPTKRLKKLPRREAKKKIR